MKHWVKSCRLKRYGLDWHWLAEQVGRSPANFLAAASEFATCGQNFPWSNCCVTRNNKKFFPALIIWTLLAPRVDAGSTRHWLAHLQDSAPFRATLQMRMKTGARFMSNPSLLRTVRSPVLLRRCFRILPEDQTASAGKMPAARSFDAGLILERYPPHRSTLPLQFVFCRPLRRPRPSFSSSDLVLFDQRIGGMARMCVDLGRVNSKYDCVLGANLNSSVRWIVMSLSNVSGLVMPTVSFHR